MLFTISIPCHPQNDQKLFQQFVNNMIKRLQQVNVIGSFDQIVIGCRMVFYCLLSEQGKKRLCIEISRMMSELFFSHVEKKLIRKLIDQQYQSPYPEDIEEIEERIVQLLDAAKREVIAKRRSFTDAIHRFLEESNSIAVDGYFHFRTRTYQKWLSRFIQEAIDEYLLDREYKEFIQLLKYFVSIQTSRLMCVHVIHKESKTFQLLKEDGTPLKVNELDQHFHEMMGQSFSGEDFIVGALLSTAPEQVVIHTDSPDENVIRTLLQIFDGRITICRGCQKCHTC